MLYKQIAVRSSLIGLLGWNGDCPLRLNGIFLAALKINYRIKFLQLIQADSNKILALSPQHLCNHRSSLHCTEQQEKKVRKHQQDKSEKGQKKLMASCAQWDESKFAE